MADEKEQKKKQLTPVSVLAGESPLVITAVFEPVAGLDRFQPAGFPEVGHVIYKAPRKNRDPESVCIVDSAASMANHLESVCMRGAHDVDLVDDLAGMPYMRCVTGETGEGGRLGKHPEVVVSSLTEGHRIASTYFLGARNKAGKWDGKGGQRVLAERTISERSFGEELAVEFGIELADSKRAHPPTSKWWNVFRTIYKYDPNALVHGVLFPQWQIKIPRVLTAHLEAFGAGRVDRSGVKFDRLGKTTSGQPIFAVDDATAREVRATFILDVALLRSFGRDVDGKSTLGLTKSQKEFLVALALWKIQRMIASPFRFRSGCHLSCTSLKSSMELAEISVNVRDAIGSAGFRDPGATDPVVTDIYWPHEELYNKADDKRKEAAEDDQTVDNQDDEDDGTE